MDDELQAHQRAAGAALSARKGNVRLDDLDPTARTMLEHLTERELAELAGVLTEDLPGPKG